MSENTVLEATQSSKAAPTEATAEISSAVVGASRLQADLSKKMADQQYVRQRFRDLFGVIVETQNARIPMKIELGHGLLNTGITTLKSVFNFKNPEQILTGVFNAAMSMANIYGTIKRFNILTTKENNMRGFLWDHINDMGPKILASRPIGPDGKPIEIEDFTSFMRGAFEAEYGLGKRSGAPSAVKLADREKLAPLLGATGWDNAAGKFKIPTV